MRKVKDAVDLTTNEKIYFKGHAKATYLSDGRNVEEALGKIPSAKSDVFKAIYGVTTYEEIKAAYDSGKVVHCDYESLCYVLSRLNENVVYFETTMMTTNYVIYCNANTNKWSPLNTSLEKSTNKVTSLSSASTDTQYPSAKAVYDILQNVGGGSDVFVAEYGVTTYNEILEAYNADKIVICKYNNVVYRLVYAVNIMHFAANVNKTLMYVRCPQSNKWQQSTENTEHKLETLDNGNAKITIAGNTTEVATPQYVENAIQQSGGSSATPDWNAKEGDAGYIKNKPFNLETKEIDFELDGGRATAYVSDIFDYEGLYILDKLIQFNGNYNFTIDCYEGFEAYYGITIECNGNDIYITPNHTDEYDPIENMVDYCNEVIKIFKIKVIDSFFIPNTVLKTTPQKLSDEAKNQALANLGIKDKFQLYQENGGRFFTNENVYNIFDALRNESAHYYMDLSINNVLDIGMSYSFSDLGISYSDLLGIIYYSKNVIISFGKDFITLTCPGEGNDRSLSFESDAGYNMTINIVEQTLILNQN